MSSSNINAGSFKTAFNLEIPKFDGTFFQRYEKDMTAFFISLGLLNIIDDSYRVGVKPTEPENPPTPPHYMTALATETAAETRARDEENKRSNMEWEQAIKIWTLNWQRYVQEKANYESTYRDWTNKNITARGILKQSLSDAVWNAVKTETFAARIWTTLKDLYGKKPISSVMDVFNKIKNFHLDFSNPVPQLAEFQRLYDEIPEYDGNKFLSQPLAAAILLHALPLRTGDAKIDSVYHFTYQNYLTEEGDPHTWTLDALKKSIVEDWEGCFMALPEKDRPKKGTTYQNLDRRQEAKKSSGIHNKGKNPQYQQQQQQLSSTAPAPAADEKKKRRNRQRGRGKNEQSATAIGSPPPAPEPAAPAIKFSLPVISQPPPPPPTHSTVFTADTSGKLVTRSQPLRGPDRPHGRHPYREVHGARKLAERIGVQPTQQTLKGFEDFPGIASIEELPPVASSSKTTTDQISLLERMSIDCNPWRPEWNDEVNMTQDETTTTGWGDEPMEDTGMDFTRQVPIGLSGLMTLTDLPFTGCSTLMSVDTPMNYKDHFVYCAACKGKGKETENWAPWILDSSASVHFTGESSDFADLKLFPKDKRPMANTANSTAQILGEGTIFIKHDVRQGKTTDTHVTRLHPVMYMSGMDIRLLSMGQHMQNGHEVHGNKDSIYFSDKRTKKRVMMAENLPFMKTIYLVHSRILTGEELKSVPLVYSVDFDTWHRRMGHPSNQVLDKMRTNTQNFPSDLRVPKDHSPCRGCAEGKMHSRSFPDSEIRASKPFERVHSDLKQFPKISYGKFKYFISFIDDYSLHAWIALLKNKSDAFTATKHFIAAAQNQFSAQIKTWRSDNGGEYIDKRYETMLKEQGIAIERSVPNQPQMNGRAERFNRTIDEKSQAMRFDACLPESWWEFTCLHAVFIYNRTPVRRLNWKTPMEVLKGTKPDVSKLRVLGCGAYVFIPKDVRKSKLSPKSELMIFLGYKESENNLLFMRQPNNVLFTAATATFDEKLFPKCKNDKTPGSTNLPKRRRSNNPDITVEYGDDEDDDYDGYVPQFDYDDHPLDNNPQNYHYDSDSSDDPNSHDDDEIDRQPVPPQTPSPPRTPPRREQTPLDPPTAPQRPQRNRGNRGRGAAPGDNGGNADGPRRSERNRKQTRKDGNVYQPGTHTDTDHRKRLPQADKLNSDTSLSPDDSDTWDPSLVAKLASEGGARFWNFLLAQRVSDLPDPTRVRDWTRREISKLPTEEQAQWFEAERAELEALKKRKVYEIVDLPAGRKAIKCRWVYDIKSDGRKKARLVAKGFSQIEGLDFDEIFSPVVRFESVRTILALAALENWTVESLDVMTAFLYGNLDEEIYMEQPPGYAIKGQERKVLKLKKAIYGLKQAARAWWVELAKSLKELGFDRIYADAGIFICRHSNGTFAIVLAYVDDILLVGPDRAFILSRKKSFMDVWECRDLGICREFLRMKVEYDGNKIKISQSPYAHKVVERFGMQDSRHAQTPLPTGYKPEPWTGSSTSELRSKYQQVIGSLLYLMIGTRPDLCFAVCLMAKFAANPSQEHMNKAMYILRYVNATCDYSLVLDGATNEGIYSYVDASWADDQSLKPWRSVEGWFISLAGSAIKWHSRTIKDVAQSSTVSEYMALSGCARDCAWYTILLQEIGRPVKYIPVYCDNNGAIFNAQNPHTGKGTKHIELPYHYVREQVEKGKIRLFRVESAENHADMMTKNLGPQKFLYFRKHLGLEFYSSFD